MSRRAGSPFALAAVLVAALSWLCWRGGVVPTSTSPPVSGPGAEATEPAEAAIPADAGETAGRSGPPVTREAVAASRATIRGRWVDERGAPLAGVRVELRGRPANAQRTAEYVLEHGDVIWTPPAEVATGADGCFELEFDPPPPYAFELETTCSSRAAVLVLWDAIASDAAIDLGDVELGRGVAVRGRVVDGDAVGIAAVSVSLSPVNVARSFRPGVPWRYRGASCRTGADGSFELRRAIEIGSYRVTVGDRVVRAPDTPVELVAPGADLRVVADTIAKGDTIEGVVVGARGEPIADAKIVRVADRALVGIDAPATLAALQGAARTYRNGAFRLSRRPQDTGDRLLLAFSADGRESVELPEPVAWNTRDLRVVLPDGPTLTIRVTRADDERPVERFGVTIVPASPDRIPSTPDLRLRHAGDHPGGVLVLPMSVGTARVAVVPPESSGLAASEARQMDVVSGFPQILEFPLQPLGEREVVVVTAAGEPVPRARVEFVRNPAGFPVTGSMQAVAPEAARTDPSSHVVALWSAATTDVHGRAVARGPCGPGHALRLAGSDFAPRIVEPFAVDGPAPARIVVSRGATLRGHLQPAAAVAALREQAGLPPHGAVGGRRRALLPTIALVDSDGHVGVAAEVDDDGTFVATGIAPGTWDVRLHTAARKQSRAGTHANDSRVVRSGLVVIGEEEHELVIDVGAFVPRRVELILRVGGEPFAGAADLHCALGAPGVAPPRSRAATFAAGRCTTDLAAGVWQLTVNVLWGDGPARLRTRPFAVGPGVPESFAFDLRHAWRTIRVLDPDGAPAAELPIALRPESADCSVPAMTDVHGRARVHGPPGVAHLRARRRPLADIAACVEWLETQPGAAWTDPDVQARAQVDLEGVVLVEGGGDEVTLRLPPAWKELPR